MGVFLVALIFKWNTSFAGSALGTATGIHTDSPSMNGFSTEKNQDLRNQAAQKKRIQTLSTSDLSASVDDSASQISITENRFILAYESLMSKMIAQKKLPLKVLEEAIEKEDIFFSEYFNAPMSSHDIVSKRAFGLLQRELVLTLETKMLLLGILNTQLELISVKEKVKENGVARLKKIDRII